jgi:hypothetical protein
VKARSDGFRELCAWLDGRDVLIVKADFRGQTSRRAAGSGESPKRRAKALASCG